MPVNEFLADFGFSLDPFESTNAENEPELGNYFVPPPYFPTVMGDPASPKSHVVLAPRGGGKTAQRRMIENRSTEDRSFLCITYDKFDQAPDFKLKHASWAYHMNQVCRLIITGVLVMIDEDPSLAEPLTTRQKQILKFQVDRFLGSLSSEQFKTATDSIKSFGDKAKDFWNRYGGPLAAALKILMKKAGLDDVQVPSELVEETKQDESIRFHYEQLTGIVRALGMSSTYVLIDRVDETTLTSGDAASTLEFIRTLAYDLPTLETPGVAFKFFLWDKIESGLRAGGARPDRVPLYTLRWTLDELEMMLTRRLLAYSGGLIESMNQLLSEGSKLNLHRLVAYLGAGSPRDMIRVAQRIVAEQTRTSAESQALDEKIVWVGIRQFANERAEELCGPNYLAELKKVGEVTFTINHLSSNIFRVRDQAARRKVQLWGNAGVVEKIGEIPNPPNRPLYLFGVTDLRVAVAMMSADDVAFLLGNIAIVCPSCDFLCITDRREVHCIGCGSVFDLGEGKSLMEICAR